MAEDNKKDDGSERPATGRISPWKKALFSLVAALLFFGLLELVLAIFGVRPLLFEDDPYVGFASKIPLFVKQKDQRVTAQNKVKWFNEQSFASKKGKDTQRIFCMGGSTTYGRPFRDATSFCGWLREYLPAADASKRWELVNAGGISYASYRIAALMEELADYDPDLFIIYCGHNEFLEQRTYGELMDMPSAVRGLQASLSKSRTYSLISRVIKGGKRSGDDTDDTGKKLDAEVNTILDTVGKDAYTRDEEWKQQILAHYRFNLARMVDIARAVGAKVVFVMPGSNLKSSSPFKSENDVNLNVEDFRRWEKLFAEAQSAHAGGDNEAALVAIDQAVLIDGLHAHAHYLRGRILEALGKTAAAKAAYELALENDICPLRMLAEMRPILTAVANERGVPVVDFHALMEERAQDGIPGEDEFLDHVHPTIESHRLLGLALVDQLERQGVLTRSGSWNGEVAERIKQKVMAGVTDYERGIALRNLANVLKWAGKYEDAYTAAKKSLALTPGDAYANFVTADLAEKLGKKDEAIRRYKFIADFELDYKEAPYLVEVPYSYAVLLAERGEYIESVRMLRKALKLKPDHKGAAEALPLALQNLGMQYLHIGKGELAAEALGELIKLKPGDPAVQSLFGIALIQAGRPQEAIPHLQAALKVNANDPGTHNNLATAHAQSGDKQNAAIHFGETVRLDPNHVGAISNLGELHLETGELDKAESYFNLALELQPGNAMAKARLAQIQKRRAAAPGQ